jgi:hypothetical protein
MVHPKGAAATRMARRESALHNLIQFLPTGQSCSGAPGVDHTSGGSPTRPDFPVPPVWFPPCPSEENIWRKELAAIECFRRVGRAV